MLAEGLILFVTCVYIYHKWSFQYWKRKNIFSLQGEFLFGNIKEVIFHRKSLITIFSEIYEKHKSEGLIGFFSFYRPMLLVSDPSTIQDVLVSKFNNFSDNGYRIYKTSDPMFGINPFCTTGLHNWKKIRGIHVPFHTAAKLKEMLPIMRTVGSNLIKYIEENRSKPIDIMETMGYYTMENVAACAYGIEPSVFSDKDNAFRQLTSSHLFSYSSLADLSAWFFPTLSKILPLRIVSKYAQNFFVSMVKSSIDHKKKNNSPRTDLITHLMKYHKKKLEEKSTGLTDLEFAGHSMTVYLDGYETSASELSFIILELANHPEIQEKLRQEIMLTGCKLNDFDFETINSLSYMLMVMNEVLRMYPLLPVLSRECTEPVQIKSVTIDKGTKVFIPVKCLHYDPDFFPDPLTFKPERFSEENSIVKYSFLPFGEGPRMCLGSRFALLQLKVALVSILLNYRILPISGKEKEEIMIDKESPFVVTPKRGTKLTFHKL